MTTVTTRTIEYVADGLTMIGHLALPAGVDRRPAVLVGPEGMGLSYDGSTADYITERPYGFKFRKFSKQTFSAAGARYGSTFKDLFKLPNTEVRLTTNGHACGAAVFTDTRSSASAFYQTWKRCS